MKYDMHKGNRLKRYFWGIKIKGYWIKENPDDISRGLKWYLDDEIDWEYNHSNIDHGVKTIRRFRKYLKMVSKYLPKGTEVTLISNYRGYDVTGYTR